MPKAVEELPNHAHTGSLANAGNHTHGIMLPRGDANYSNGNSNSTIWGPNNNKEWYTKAAGSHTHNLTISSTGSNKAHNNIPPFYVCYMWRRTA